MTLSPMAFVPEEITQQGQMPDGLIVRLSSVSSIPIAAALARQAAALAADAAPRSSGRSSRAIQPVYGPGWFGIRWEHPYVWYQDQGIGPFTMRSLQGKTIPMWVDDEGGEESKKIPARDRARRTRVTVDGRRQVLIFRKATRPGAPGRIGKRTRLPNGRIARGNVGVKWRHPGLPRRGFLEKSLEAALRSYGSNRLPHGEATPVTLRAR